MAEKFDLLIKGGILVNGNGLFRHDLAIYDPAVRHTLSGKRQHTKAGYSLYEGRECLGQPYMTFQRGRAVLDRDRLVARPGDGKYLRLR